MDLMDGGKGLFSSTTMENTVKALVKSMSVPSEKTANRTLLIQDFTTSQSELLSTIERLSGEKWTVTDTPSKDIIRTARENLAESDDPFVAYKNDKANLPAAFKLIEVGFVSGTCGGNLPGEGPLDNELLGLVPRKLEDVVREALAASHSVA